LKNHVKVKRKFQDRSPGTNDAEKLWIKII